jgi:hypothetical protein
LLDPVPAATIFMAFQEVYEWLNKNGVLKKFLYLDGEILVALPAFLTSYALTLNIGVIQTMFQPF